MSAREHDRLKEQIERLMAETRARRGRVNQEGDTDAVRDCKQALRIMQGLLRKL